MESLKVFYLLTLTMAAVAAPLSDEAREELLVDKVMKLIRDEVIQEKARLEAENRELKKQLSEYKPVCYGLRPVGMETGDIPQDSITASSTWRPETAPYYARYASSRYTFDSHAWCAAFNDRIQWIQVDLGKPMAVAGVIVQGQQGFPHWVSSFKLLYSLDQKDWMYYQDETGNDKVFSGNFDSTTGVRHDLKRQPQARYVRLNPHTWHYHVCLRFEVMTCVGQAELSSSLNAVSMPGNGDEVLVAMDYEQDQDNDLMFFQTAPLAADVQEEVVMEVAQGHDFRNKMADGPTRFELLQQASDAEYVKDVLQHEMELHQVHVDENKEPQGEDIVLVADKNVEVQQGQVENNMVDREDYGLFRAVPLPQEGWEEVGEQVDDLENNMVDEMFQTVPLPAEGWEGDVRNVKEDEGEPWVEEQEGMGESGDHDGFM
ncbi:RS1 [Branchiostoma lanceolatum]|uniref:RS1 protein n=1 Tax=Branchiostoma lanceolatum TaxID=7740 RepID=A0A8J9YSI0_BRALA|nr:RS1 [Branchiostoma lanceolatum]